MKRAQLKYLFLLAIALCTGCRSNKAQMELLKWQISLHKDDKRPYGAYLAYESLKYYFPNAVIEPLADGFRYNNMDNNMMVNTGGRSLLILQGLDFYLSDNEWIALKQFITNGNEVMIFCRSLDNKIEEELGYYKRIIDDEGAPLSASADNANRNALMLTAAPHQRYGYQGRSLRNYFVHIDKPPVMHADSAEGTSGTEMADGDSVATEDEGGTGEEETSEIIRCDTLGMTGEKANFIRFRKSNGHLSLHAAPLALSNYFLLQSGNTNYLTGIWQTLPSGINKIYWQDYYQRSTDTSGLSVLLRYPATRHALLIGVLTLLVYVLFEGKRKQRAIPVIPPLKNDSVSFVETVGRLYYNKGDHANLAGKMLQQFLEWVRLHYFLNTNLIDEHFVQQLAIKSGMDESVIKDMVLMIQEIRSGKVKIDDAYLYRLYNTIQQFYKKNHS